MAVGQLTRDHEEVSVIRQDTLKPESRSSVAKSRAWQYKVMTALGPRGPARHVGRPTAL
jgi:hypothetical protein